MKSKKKLSKAVLKDLRSFAKSLPKIYRVNGQGDVVKIKRYCRGRQLSAEQQSSHKKNGTFRPDGWYSWEETHYEDPYPMLEKTYINSGREATIEACKKWMDRYETQKMMSHGKEDKD